MRWAAACVAAKVSLWLKIEAGPANPRDRGAEVVPAWGCRPSQTTSRPVTSQVYRGRRAPSGRRHPGVTEQKCDVIGLVRRREIVRRPRLTEVADIDPAGFTKIPEANDGPNMAVGQTDQIRMGERGMCQTLVLQRIQRLIASFGSI